MSTSAVLTARRQVDETGWPRRARTRTVWLAAVALTLSLLVMLEWFARTEAFERFGSENGPMKFNAAICFALLACAHLANRRAVSRVLLCLVLAAATVLLTQHAFGLDLGIDELVVRDWSATADTAHPGRVPPTTAVCAMLLVSAALLADRGWSRLCQVVSLSAAVVALVTGVGYLYGVDTVFTLGPYQPMAVGSVVNVLILGSAQLFAVEGGVLSWISFGRDTGARLQRLLLPVAVIGLPMVGWLGLRGAVEGFFPTRFGIALIIAVIIILVLAVSYGVGRQALRSDRERDVLVGELGRVNQELEDLVRSRSHQLNRQRTKLALLEERDRIARDLHDRVIQRIFAAGLQIGAMSRVVGKHAAAGNAPATLPGQLDTIAAELDLAIRELRNSIFELTSIDDHDDIQQVVRDIVARASRILGFMPRVEVTGEIAGIRPDLVANLASVIQEALSNVARHARASSAEVTLHGTQTHIQLRIVDDGIGLPDPLPRSSGISNLMNRARNLGGSATWDHHEPTGTLFVWRVPRHATEAPGVEGAPTAAVTHRNRAADGVSR